MRKCDMGIWVSGKYKVTYIKSIKRGEDVNCY